MKNVDWKSLDEYDHTHRKYAGLTLVRYWGEEMLVRNIFSSNDFYF